MRPSELPTWSQRRGDGRGAVDESGVVPDQDVEDDDRDDAEAAGGVDPGETLARGSRPALIPPSR